MINVENLPLEYFETYKKKYNAFRYLEDCNDFELKEAIRIDLMKKQRGQCAYCERAITSSSFHIDHIYPRDKAHKLECEYSNLILSCENIDSCGIHKANKSYKPTFIHPVLNNPSKYFTFNEDGHIYAVNNISDAIKTIEFLNLDSKKLVRLRKNIIFYLKDIESVENITNYFSEFENLLFEHAGARN